MRTTRDRSLRSQDVRSKDEIRAFCGLAIVGLVNPVLRYIVFSANYLIIPFPRPAVTLLETLPAIIIQLFLPVIVARWPVRYAIRPPIFAACWALARIVTWATPPNVPSLFRVLMTMLASATAAGTEASALGMLRYYGRTGLAGWGFGTGLGGVAVAVAPWWLTIWKGGALRDGIDYILTLAVIMVVAFLLALPATSMHEWEAEQADEDWEGQQGQLLLQDPLETKRTRAMELKQSLALVSSLVTPYMGPLFLAFVVQGTIWPGISRAMGNSVLEDYLQYRTAYGVTFCVGSLLGRTSILSLRIRRIRVLQAFLLVALIAMILNVLFLVAQHALFFLVFFMGLATGLVYVNIVATVLDEAPASGARELSLQTVGAGETAGLMMGDLVGALTEASLCGVPRDGTRWCHLVR